ncbi:MAG TPA: TnsA-like heteromeric transposase endonuclease subunit [Aldersonia sp.]
MSCCALHKLSVVCSTPLGYGLFLGGGVFAVGGVVGSRFRCRFLKFVSAACRFLSFVSATVRLTGVARIGEVEVRYVDEHGGAVATTAADVDVRRVVRGRPVRKVRSHARRRHYEGLFWSATNGDHVPYESRLELDRLWLADFAPQVVRIAAQPLWLCGQDDKATRRHVPDLLLETADGRFTFVDVKPAEFAGRDEVARVFAWTESVCASRGWGFEVWSGADPVMLANVRAIGVARREGLIGADVMERVEAGFVPGMTIDEVVAAAEDRRSRSAVLAKLWSGDWSVDMSAPLSGESVLARSVAA